MSTPLSWSWRKLVIGSSSSVDGKTVWNQWPHECMPKITSIPFIFLKFLSDSSARPKDGRWSSDLNILNQYSPRNTANSRINQNPPCKSIVVQCMEAQRGPVFSGAKIETLLCIEIHLIIFHSGAEGRKDYIKGTHLQKHCQVAKDWDHPVQQSLSFC